MSALNEHLRLTLLRLLSGAPGYRANSSILHGEAIRFGFGVTRDQVKTELAWLAEQGAIVSETVADLVVADLTERGLEVERGLAFMPGVQRPTPRG